MQLALNSFIRADSLSVEPLLQNVQHFSSQIQIENRRCAIRHFVLLL